MTTDFRSHQRIRRDSLLHQQECRARLSMHRASLRRQIEEGPSPWCEVPQQLTAVAPDFPEVQVTFPAGTLAYGVQRILAETVEVVYEFESRFLDKRGEPNEITLDHARHEAELVAHLWWECQHMLPARWHRLVMADGLPVPQSVGAMLAAWRAGGYRSVPRVANLAIALSEIADKIAEDEDLIRFIEGWVLTVRAVSHAVFPVVGQVWVPPSEAAVIVGRSKRTIQRWKSKGLLSTFGEWVLLSDVRKIAA
ncbi:hypothetical protein [Corynebacterium sp. AOP40-4SA-5]|uniref:hypothetical protein n=1 Tax=Corynebacterium sp. AOP40-4SA-5 TaxID=3457678 RepID=UPI0040336DDB